MSRKRSRWSHGALGSGRAPLLARKESSFRLQRLGRRDRPVGELPSVGTRVLVLAGIAAVIFGILIFRLWFLQILSGEQYVAAANENRLRSIKLEARRGLIKDRNGKVLVTNAPSLIVGIRPMDVPDDELAPVIVELGDILNMPPGEVLGKAMRSMEVPVDRLAELVGEVAGSSSEEAADVLAEVVPSVYVAPKERPDAAAAIAETLGLPEQEVEKLLEEAVSKRSGYAYDLAVIKEGVSERKAIELRELAPSLPGVEVRKGFVRDYPEGTLAAHLLGSVGEITAEQLDEDHWRKRRGGDVIGQGGVEYTYDEWLRGTDGTAKVEVDSFGRPKETVPGGELPQTGNSLVLTIDAKIQKATEKALITGLQIAHNDQFWSANGGAAVVMDASNGEIVAMASYPTFDPGVWTDGISKAEKKQYFSESANRPFFDRAIQAGYPAASTFKVVDAIAGLETGIISPHTSFLCEGDFELKGLTWKCWVHPVGHGRLDLTQAIAQSCDVYFYQVGRIFFSRKGTELADWAHRLGLGQATGIDLPGEIDGLVPTPEWRKEHFKDSPDPTDTIWKPGNSVNLAIGQGDLQATPLQIAVTYAAIANGGYLVTPHVGLKVEDAAGETVQKLRAPEPRKIGAASQTIEVVQNALRYAAASSTGTSVGVFGSYPVSVCGKTGTAEVFGKDDYAWYASYAPQEPGTDGKQYVVVLMIEEGGHGGSTAAPAVRRIYDAIFDIESGDVVNSGPTD